MLFRSGAAKSLPKQPNSAPVNASNNTSSNIPDLESWNTKTEYNVEGYKAWLATEEGKTSNTAAKGKNAAAAAKKALKEKFEEFKKKNNMKEPTFNSGKPIPPLVGGYSRKRKGRSKLRSTRRK